jgi:hypothetical protein
VGIKLTQWGLHIGWSVFIGGLLGVIGLLTGVGYLIIGILYAEVWLALLIGKGKDAEEWEVPTFSHPPCRFHEFMSPHPIQDQM